MVFFVSTLMCHGELARRRPPARYLTAFYMWMSVGGMIGGIAAGLIAPYVFNWVAEYPILIALAVLCRPGLAIPRGRAAADLVRRARRRGARARCCADLERADLRDGAEHHRRAAAAPAIVLWRVPLPFAAIIAFVFVANQLYTEDATMTVRSFFGVHKVYEDDEPVPHALHGTTLHGGQRIRDPGEKSPAGREARLAMYYYDGSAIAQAIDAARERAGGRCASR